MNTLHLSFLRGLMLKQVWEANNSVLSDDLFTGTDIRTLYSYVSELHDERAGDIEPDDLRNKIEVKYQKDSTRKQEMLEIIDDMEEYGPVAANTVQPLLADFASRELGRKAAQYILNNTEGEGWDVTKAYDFLERAISITTGVDLDVDDLMNAPPPSLDHDRPGIVTVGLGKKMDVHLGGGCGQGELMLWLAGYGQGKTSLMINQGVAIAELGGNVLHLSLEISAAKCMQRVDQKLTGMSTERRLESPKAVMSARKNLAGRYFVKDWSHAKVTVDDIKALVRRMEAKGDKIDVIVVDYLELMVPTRINRHGERFNYSQVTKDLRSLANELQVPIITAWQVNRSGYEKYMISAVDVSECWDVVKHADIILGLNQNDQERDSKMLRVNIIKQRESTSRPMEYYESDLDCMQIREAKEQGHEDDDPGALGTGS